MKPRAISTMASEAKSETSTVNTAEESHIQYALQSAEIRHPAYGLSRSSDDDMVSTPIGNELESLEYSSDVDGSESYLAIRTLGESSVTGHAANFHTKHADATEVVHEMHLALLYLLSNPEEFSKALASQPAQGATTLAEWNQEYDTESVTEAESVNTSNNNDPMSVPTPLPYVVFADDAEVVLPQAHTASQLFGVERIEGIELEAAAGIPAISQLFLRWLGKLLCSKNLSVQFSIPLIPDLYTTLAPI